MDFNRTDPQDWSRKVFWDINNYLSCQILDSLTLVLLKILALWNITLSFGEWFPIFWRNIVPLSWESRRPKIAVLCFLESLGNNCPLTVSYLFRLESSVLYYFIVSDGHWWQPCEKLYFNSHLGHIYPDSGKTLLAYHMWCSLVTPDKNSFSRDLQNKLGGKRFCCSSLHESWPQNYTICGAH
jgi:hypothetical protein